MMTTQRVLNKDVYDTLEFSALAFGGIGGGSMFDCDETGAVEVPFCAVGHLRFFSGDTDVEYVTTKGGAGAISVWENDAAVREINRRRRAFPGARVTFKQWCKELNVIRGA